MGMAATPEGPPRDRSANHFIGTNYAIFYSRSLAVCDYGSSGRQALLANCEHDACGGDCHPAEIINPASVETYRAGGSFECAAEQELLIWAALRLTPVCLDACMLVLCASKA